MHEPVPVVVGCLCVCPGTRTLDLTSIHESTEWGSVFDWAITNGGTGVRMLCLLCCVPRRERTMAASQKVEANKWGYFEPWTEVGQGGEMRAPLV